MKIIIAGSRTFNDYEYLKKKMNAVTKNLKKEIIVVSGGAKGADKLGEKWAFEKMYTKEVFYPDYNKHDKSAPIIRNCEMVDSGAKALCAFWDGKSKGTEHIIEYAKKKGLKVKVFFYNKKDKKNG